MNHRKQETQINKGHHRNAQSALTAAKPQQRQRAEATNMHRASHGATKSDRKTPGSRRQKQHYHKQEIQTHTRHYRDERMGTPTTAQRRQEARTTETHQARVAG